VIFVEAKMAESLSFFLSKTAFLLPTIFFCKAARDE
jgi:hypothetical protein